MLKALKMKNTKVIAKSLSESWAMNQGSKETLAGSFVTCSFIRAFVGLVRFLIAFVMLMDTEEWGSLLAFCQSKLPPPQPQTAHRQKRLPLGL